MHNDVFSGNCPGVFLKKSVILNDTLGENPEFSIFSGAVYGTVSIDDKGSVTYIPNSYYCGTDKFSYQVCSGQPTSCDTAQVEVIFSDEIKPGFEYLPKDITIGIDDEIPEFVSLKTIDNCQETELSFEEISDEASFGCGQNNYRITRYWTASDHCGNATSHVQHIDVVDEVAPNIFRIHTLPNGSRLVAGIADFTSERWKTIHLPIRFSEKPLLFTQLITDVEKTPSVVRLRKVRPDRFEIKLQEEGTSRGEHEKEKVAWIALERGTQSSAYQFQADTISVDHTWAGVSFLQSFSETPLFFTNMQTIWDNNAGSLRNNAVNWNNAKIRIQEENSLGSNLGRKSELTAYLAIENIGDLTSRSGEKIGEVGSIKTGSEWMTVSLRNTYHNPVIMANSLSNEDFDPATVRIRNVGADSFQIRVEEWDYLDGQHDPETVAYMVVEGSLPLGLSEDCLLTPETQLILEELRAVDNTGLKPEISFQETYTYTALGRQTVRTWGAKDICGNEGFVRIARQCQGVSLRVRTLLQGPLLGSTDPDLMRDDLRKQGLIPMEEPFTEHQRFTHKGSGGREILNADLLAMEGPQAIVDWVFLELRDQRDKKQVIATTSALLQRNGQIVSPKGDSLIYFIMVPEGNYYLSVRHRNHILLLSHNSYSFGAYNIPFIDFTDVNTVGCPYRGRNRKEKMIMWSGDLNQDGRVIFQGPGNDVFDIFQSVLFDANNKKLIPNFVSRGYSNSDFNMDGKVLFQGPDNDAAALLFHTILSSPENGHFFSNFILKSGSCNQ